MRSATLDDENEVGRADSLSVAEAESLARRLAPLRLADSVREQAPLAVDHDLTELLGIADIAQADLATLWAPRPPREALRIPIGTGPDRRAGRTRHQGGRPGRHGPARSDRRAPPAPASRSCCARSCSASRRPTRPRQLNFVLVDFKGGATFASLEHCRTPPQ